MSSYQGRPGPNVSQLLQELENTNNFEGAGFLADEPSFTDELGMWINADFTNYDAMPPNTFPPGQSIDSFDASNLDAQGLQSTRTYPNYNVPIQPAPPAGAFGLENNIGSPISPTSTLPTPSRRRAETTQSQNLKSEEKARLAAEEDKRRRNTAASARFRVKKKQREQTLEKTVKEVNEKNTTLEAKVTQLELENRWLKELITEKNGKSQKEVDAALEKFRKESEEREMKREEQAAASAR